MKNFTHKIIFSILTLLIFVLIHANSVFASQIILKQDNINHSLNEQFFVDVLLDTEGSQINGIEGSINYPSDNLTLLRTEEGPSIISLWVDKPLEKNGQIHFSGIIPSGFSGIIDPFSPGKKLPGVLLRLVFQAKSDGNIYINSSDFYTSLNDGLGTTNNISQANLNLIIDKNQNENILIAKDDTKPELVADIVRDLNLFDNKYTLIFDAKDSKTGIKEVVIKEGNLNWKKIESPYLLKDQSRHSKITLQATNYSGSSIVVSINGVPYNWKYLIKIYIIVIIILILGILIIRKLYVNKHKN
jgi:hypothetical protein